jgi:prenylcysteine oxidase / farnesylcysteine lyase
VTKTPKGKWRVKSSAGTTDYTAVILAAPVQNAGITLPPSVVTQLPEVSYVDLHVTLLTTTKPYGNASYFGLGARSHVPETILTVTGAEFNSMTYHGRLINETTGIAVEPPQWVVKIFSMQHISDEWLENMFGNVGWVLRKQVRIIEPVLYMCY